MLQATAKHAPHLGQIRHLCREAARFVILLKFEHVWLDLVILLHLLRSHADEHATWTHSDCGRILDILTARRRKQGTEWACGTQERQRTGHSGRGVD